jgi:dTDP-glucose pyrophosphorylase
MRNVGINRIIVVVGYLGYEIAKTCGDGSAYGVSVEYIEQQQTLGIAHAVGQLERYIDGPFVLFLGDIFFVPADIGPIIELFQESSAAAVLAVKEESDPSAIQKNFSVILDGQDRVKRVIEKPRFPSNNLKGCGLYVFQPIVFDAIRRTPRTAMRDEYEITDSIQIMVADGHVVRASRTIEKDINLTNPRDLLLCNQEALMAQGVNSFLGSNVRLQDDTRILRSVIGDNVVIDHPIEIRNSVVFANSRVTASVNLNGKIVTADEVVDCEIF